MYENMTDCERIGMAGGCGWDCSVFQDGDCDNGLEAFTDMDMENETDEDILDLYQHYKDVEEEKRIKSEKADQIVSMNFTSPYKISDNDLYTYYRDTYGSLLSKHSMKFISSLKDHNKLSNALLESIEKRFSVMGSSLTERDAFRIFMMFIGRTDDEIIPILRKVFTKQIQFTRYKKDIEDAFYSSPAKELIEKLNVDFSYLKTDGLKNDKSFYEKELAEIVILHNDADNNVKIDMYNTTGEDKYLPKTAQDIFLF